MNVPYTTPIQVLELEELSVKNNMETFGQQKGNEGVFQSVYEETTFSKKREGNLRERSENYRGGSNGERKTHHNPRGEGIPTSWQELALECIAI